MNEIRNRSFGYLIICLLLFMGASPLWAQISLNDSVLHLKFGSRPVVNVAVRNASDQVMYVQAASELIIDPSDPDSKGAPDDQLILSPKKFSVPAKGERTVRVLMKKIPEDVEKVYRLTFAPQDQGFDAEVQGKSVGGKALAVKVLTGMGALLFVDPVNPKPDLHWERKSGKVVFSNTGTQHVRVMFAKACIGDKEADCKALEARRIYPGMTYEWAVDDRAKVTFYRKNGASGETTEVVLEPLTPGA